MNADQFLRMIAEGWTRNTEAAGSVYANRQLAQAVRLYVETHPDGGDPA